MARQLSFPRFPMVLHLLRASVLMALGASTLLSQQDSVQSSMRILGLPLTAEVRVHTRSPSILHGRYLGMARDSLALGVTTGSGPGQKVALRDITAVWFRNGNQGSTGLLLGAGIGAALGLVLALSVGETGDFNRRRVAAAGSVSFGLLGAVSGAIIGANTDRWQRVPLP